jgi:hypothetical protein
MARGGVALAGSGLASLLCRPALVFLAPFTASAATAQGRARSVIGWNVVLLPLLVAARHLR